MNELIRYIWDLRNEEGIPLYFRRNWQENYNKKPIWYIWYGTTPIAWRSSLDHALNAVNVAANVHRAIHET